MTAPPDQDEDEASDGGAGPLSCPTCRNNLAWPLRQTALTCPGCQTTWSKSAAGYLDFVNDRAPYASAIEEYVVGSQATGTRLAGDYVLPWLRELPARTVLDAGCGVASGLSLLERAGYEAWGVDLPDLGKAWRASGGRADRLVHADLQDLPFREGYFDAVVSVGVVEHIGTVDGHAALAKNYAAARERYAHELMRVTAPGGRVLIACPSKRFPFDLQHGPDDDRSRGRWRTAVFARTHVNVHRVVGDYHLPAPVEVKNLLLNAGAASVRHKPVAGFLGMSLLSGRPRLQAAASAYMGMLRGPVLGTPLNPYVVVEATKPL